MRVDILKKILAELRLKSMPKTIASNSCLTSIVYMGISDNDLLKFIVPKIIDFELLGICTTQNLKQFICDHEEITILPEPIHHIADNSQIQRRMDSLSRLLSLDNKYTACIAVTFYSGELIISANSPREKIPEELITDYLSRKVGLIQNFLIDLHKGIPIGIQPDIRKIQFSTRAKLQATDTVLKLIHPTNGGVGDIIPNSKANRHHKRFNITTHLENALLKLGEYSLLGLFSGGKQGFTLEEISTLLNKTMIIITPNTQIMGENQLHAEQSILYYLNEFTDFSSKVSAKAHVGISKLCCQACHSVLKKEDKLSYRGTHGIKFSSVFDLSTQSLFKGTSTTMRADACPQDSDSEPESYSDDEHKTPTYTEVPFVEEFLPESNLQFRAEISNFALISHLTPKKKSLSLDESDDYSDMCISLNRSFLSDMRHF